MGMDIKGYGLSTRVIYVSRLRSAFAQISALVVFRGAFFSKAVRKDHRFDITRVVSKWLVF